MHITTGVITGLFILNLVYFGAAVTKIWRYDFDIYNRENWLDGKPGENCEGLSFDAASAPVSVAIDRLNVKKIVLTEGPGVHLLDGAVIDFDEGSRDVMNCVRVKIPSREPDWALPDNWIIQGDENNVAIPHQERLPCEDDDVVFPKAWKSATCSIDEFVTVASYKFGNESVRFTNIIRLSTQSMWLFSKTPFIYVTGTACKDLTGCACHNELINPLACYYVSNDAGLNCVNGIKPVGFCYEICGASILLNPKGRFRIDDIRKHLKQYTSDTYVSKIRYKSEDNFTSNAIQVIFAEKQFVGTSLDEARHFYSQLLSDRSFGVYKVRLYTSSPYIAKGNFARTTISIIFGTFCAVVAFFGLVFLLYSPNESVGHFRERWGFSSRPLSSFSTNLFARYENSEREALVIGDAQSLGGSVLSLDRSFDNPMYGRSSPSTASTSYDTIPSTDVKVTASQISIENPVYNLNNVDNQVEDVAEEGELIDLNKRSE